MKTKLSWLITMIMSLVMVSISFGSAEAINLNYNSVASFIPSCTVNGIAYNTPVCGDVNKQTANPQQNPVINIIKDVINLLSFAVGVVVVFIIAISGITFITSGGESEKVTKAKNGLIGAVAGILIVALAQIIVIFVLDKVK